LDLIYRRSGFNPFVVYRKVIALLFYSEVSSFGHFHSASSLHFLIFHVQRILKAGKLTEKVLKLFIATGNEEVISLVQALNIRHIVTPVLPTSELFKKFIM